MTKPPEPQWEKNVPLCTDDECGRYDGKRCRLSGQRPGQICEPAVKALARSRAELLEAARKVLQDIQEGRKGCNLSLRAEELEAAIANAEGEAGNV